MQWLRQLFFYSFIALMANSYAAPTAPTPEEAQKMVQDTTEKMLAALKKDKDKLKTNPAVVYKLVDEIVLPHFDFDRMSRLVLGQNWAKSTPQQQARFINEFRALLVRTYATALVEAAGEEVSVTYQPPRVDTSGKVNTLTLRSEVSFKQKKIVLDYSMYLATDKWKIFNVSAEGISLVTNYRTEFNNDIATIGMDGLIDKIASRNKEVK